MTKLTAKAKGEFLEGIKEDILKEGKTTKGYHRAVKRFTTKEAPVPWDMRHMLQDSTDDQRCEKIAEYFNVISGEFDPLERPLECEAERTPPELFQIAGRLRSMRKPKSQVVGDIPPELATEYADILAIPLDYIFKQIYATLEWPTIWKRETITVIPKSPAPTSLSELRDLSCTPLFSKLLERFILEELKKETKLSPDQYGGIRGSGPDHFLTATWQEILECLDGNDGGAAALTSIDFAKAFNRMSHQACLKSLQEHGASEPTTSLVSAFLYGRTMSVRIGSNYSNPRPINGGSPQGSILGNYLFCITTDNLGVRADQEETGMTAMNGEGTPLAIRRNRTRATTRRGGSGWGGAGMGVAAMSLGQGGAVSRVVAGNPGGDADDGVDAALTDRALAAPVALRL